MKIIINICLLLLIANFAFGQERDSTKISDKKNSISIELGGENIYGSINYERFFIKKKLTLSTEIGAMPFRADNYIVSNLSINISYFNTKIKPIIGISYTLVVDLIGPTSEMPNRKSLYLHFSPSVGAKTDFNKYYLKTSFVIIFSEYLENKFLPWGSITFGYYF